MYKKVASYKQKPAVLNVTQQSRLF